MKASEFRSRFEELWRTTNMEAKRRKDSQLALEELNKIYRRLGEQEREWANQIVSNWISSDNPSKRFDALMLIDRNEIIQALPTLREYSERLRHRSDHEAPFERKKVQRIIERLVTASGSGQA